MRTLRQVDARAAGVMVRSCVMMSKRAAKRDDKKRESESQQQGGGGGGERLTHHHSGLCGLSRRVSRYRKKVTKLWFMF